MSSLEGGASIPNMVVHSARETAGPQGSVHGLEFHSPTFFVFLLRDPSILRSADALDLAVNGGGQSGSEWPYVMAAWAAICKTHVPRAKCGVAIEI